MDCLSFGHLEVAINDVWQIGELKTQFIFLSSPFLCGVWSIELSVVLLIELDALVDELVTNTLSASSNVPVAERWYVSLDSTLGSLNRSGVTSTARSHL